MIYRFLIVFLLFLATAPPSVSIAQSAADPSSPSIAAGDSIDSSGHTRLKAFGSLYGAYLGIAVPVAADANEVAPYSLGLIAGPSLGMASAAGYARRHSFSQANAITLSSLTWFGAMQGHLWASAIGGDDANSNAAAGVLASLVGLTLGMQVASTADIDAGHAASLGAGNWWGMALGYQFANASVDAGTADTSRGAALGAALGVGTGALLGQHATHSDIRYLHLGAAMGWLYSAGLIVLQEPEQQGETLLQIAGIGSGMTLGLLTSKYKPWRTHEGLQLDHSGRFRAQFFSMIYGAYLATVIPLAAGVDSDDEDYEKTYALSYMHVPLGLLLGTTMFTRNSNVTKTDALTVSGLTWFGAMQGAMWASASSNPQTEEVATWSAAGSAAGLFTGALVSRQDLSPGQAAMLGAGNWWGSFLGLLGGNVVGGEDISGEALAASVAFGSMAGVAVAPLLGSHMSGRQVSTMHAGGLAGLFFGAGVLLVDENVSVSAANLVMAMSTFAGLAIGARMDDASPAEQSDFSLDAQPFVTRRTALSGEMQTMVGVSVSY